MVCCSQQKLSNVVFVRSLHFILVCEEVLKNNPSMSDCRIAKETCTTYVARPIEHESFHSWRLLHEMRGLLKVWLLQEQGETQNKNLAHDFLRTIWNSRQKQISLTSFQH
jgi:hypothetical protein